MRYKWLNKKNNKQIIIFFNGWGMDECVINRLNVENYDVVMFYDYNNLEIDFDFSTLNEYQSRHLVAWSMGVMVATLFDINYETKTAINGTLIPIDDKFGIPHKIYNLTLKGFSPKGAERFLKTMFNEECEIPVPQREYENQKSELVALTEYKSNMNFKYTRIILSDNDKIIPTKNQSAFWNMEPNLVSGHAPFNHFQFWSELL